ncbi:beta-lactamase regulating signal transducer with metallopeptidase domain [Archangium gephyra]|uniref:Beta-lactamase regulating signal transducer with metallopeptidase domain n=1 Tax=Archangium gephyra TaxID=48 RepID=A0AAC8TF60_9BACT|nr:M56 and MltD domain-containing protein [Archangium gephyra]AKJ03673.1 Soluble lytic murein transglycosylase [Archangium gephyra]REG22547.1 beta-lactamase regulating signal transducer with metallopeptidase domain [Archangium gephyra]
MSAALRALATGYGSVAVLLTVGFVLLRAALALMGRWGLPLSARQTLRAGRATLALALLLPPVCMAVRGLVPTGPLFTFERSVVRLTTRLPEPAWTSRPAATAPRPTATSSPFPVGMALALVLGTAAAVHCARQLRQHVRLIRRLESQPRLRQVGRVAVVLRDTEGTAFSTWFPRRAPHPTAWVAVPASLLEDAEGLRLTVLHELQHHRQRDTVLAYVRLVLGALFFWNPVVRAFERWLATCQELACDEALVSGGKAHPQPYARCLLEAALRATHAPPLPAGVTGMAHPTKRRIEMLFQPRPSRPHRTAGLVAAVALTLVPLALWAQSATRGRAVTLAEAQALAQASQREGDLPVVVDAQVVEKLNQLVTTPKGRAFMKKALDNLGTHREALTRTLRARKLPEGLLAVTMIESAVTNLPEASTEPSLAPGMRGAGVWMFLPSTARQYGLRVDAEVDERLDVARETEAAAALFSDLHGRYKDWRLALAAYNQGEKKVDRVLSETGVRDTSELVRAGHLNDYTSTVQAGLLLLRNPHLLD